MSEQLEPELERVARMLAAAGPLPDAPATLRERALRIPDGGSAPDKRARRPNRRLPPSRSHAAGSAGRDRSRWRVSRLPWWRSPSSRRSRSCATTAADSVHRIDLAPRPFAPQGGGAANVVRHGDGTSEIKLTVWKMPSAGHGRTYEAWLGRKGDRWPLGTFSTDTTGKATITFRVSAQGREQLPLAVGHERAHRRQHEAERGHGSLGPADLRALRLRGLRAGDR